MKRALVVFCGALVFSALGFVPLAAAAEDDAWIEDFAQASALSKKLNRPMLVEFTGSDWCPPCIQMNKQIFSTKKFQDFAKDKLVLMKVDFPMRKPQNTALKQQNLQLDEKFGVNGAVPTVVLLSPDGKVLAAHQGLFMAGPDAFIQWIRDNTKA
ncbi:thioredoxin-like [Terrimicrobium sacchariphilum]|uniref:Thioredoxin-like n=1 Tax=Terrimicrobium sacchariphilum TaxID=690879 RepID=A0A146G7Z1_TERSA|nr:thioredoxin family protein [Terrimicrobium sacchariphilum]GAT33453.1 thioredoxin-like [Terrimicrobium sacchariphilum]